MVSPITSMFKTGTTTPPVVTPRMTPYKPPVSAPMMTPVPQNASFAPPKAVPQVNNVQYPSPIGPTLPTPVPQNLPQGTQNLVIPTPAPQTTVQPPQAPVLPHISAVQEAEKAYQKSQQISPEELSTQEELDKLIADAERIKQSGRLGLQSTSEQAIPMEFITGQQKSIENRLTNQLAGLSSMAEPLERKLARLQAARTSSLEASKFALERADKEFARKEESKAPTTIETAEGIMQWNPSTKSWTPTGMSKPITATAEAKAMELSDKERSAQQSTSNALGILNSLLSDNNWKAISGPAQSAWIPFVGKPEVGNQYNQLKSMLALGARSLLKGSGAISDYEARTLEKSTSALGRNLGESQMEEALRTVRGVLKTNQGLETEVIVVGPNGEVLGQGLLNGEDIYEAVRDGNTIKYL